MAQRIKIGLGNVAVALTVLAAALGDGVARADDAVTSGHYWLERCSSTDLPDQLSCNAIMIGIIGFHSLPENPKLYCEPDDATFGQFMAVIMKYLQDNPTKLRQPFVRLAVDALASTWPCPQNSN